MMKRGLLAGLFLAFACTVIPPDPAMARADAGEPARLMRHPDISRGRIAFSYQNDLWLVPEEGGIARRLTVHPGVEDYPRFSPDGNRIAFSGDYNESKEALFVIPSEGGTPRQLTYHSEESHPVAWTRDGGNIVFCSQRESFVRFFTKLFSVPVEGGTPVELEFGKASFASFNEKGDKIAFNRHPALFWWWKRYKGSMNQDIWIYDFADKQFQKITDYSGNDSWPMWTGNRIYFASDRADDVANIFVYDLGTDETRQITRFKKHGVTWPSMSSNGERIVFERDARIYVLNTETEKTREIDVYVLSDDNRDMISYVDPLKFLRSFAVSPTAKRIAFEARGDVFTAPAEHGDVRNLTQTSGARESSPAWSPDGQRVAYVSDKSGDDEIYIVDQMGEEDQKKLTSSGHFKQDLVWSPRSDKLLFTTDESALYLLDLNSGKEELVARNEHREITHYSWSPDGNWFAYDFARRNRNRDVFIYNVKNGDSHQITTDLGDDYEPMFTPDGKYLLLITDRGSGRPVLARVSLTEEKELPFEFEDDEEAVVEDDSCDDTEEKEDRAVEDEDENKEKKEKESKKGKKKKIDVQIEFSNIEERIRKIPRSMPSPLNVQATEDYYYFLVRSRQIPMFAPSYDLYMYDLKKKKNVKVASGVFTYGISDDKKKLAYYDGDFTIIKVGQKASAKKTSDSTGGDKGGKLDIKRKTSMKLDRRAEWRQIFNEGWRVVKYYFYDPNLHGVDWDEVKEYYESLLPYVRTRRELNLLMTEMVGELNASHQGVSKGDLASDTPKATVAFLGAKIKSDEETGYPRIERIYKGDNFNVRYRSPLDNDFIKIAPGDYLLAIEGHELEPGENFYRYLVDKTRSKITITTNSRPEMKDAVKTTIDPLNYDMTLQYKDWVDGNEAFVEEKSENRIGYMHLRDMMLGGWNEFQEKFEKYRYKDAIIIDVRYNGGGNIDERIIDLIERRPYQIQRTRNESAIERPREGFYGEVVVLINEYSFSDAEVFPSAVKERRLGTLIGVPTLGYVIAVSSYALNDGGIIRRTHTGIWEISTGEMLESRGVEPDILVESPPEMEMEGRDLQLEKAVDFLMEKIGQHHRDYDYDIPIDKR